MNKDNNLGRVLALLSLTLLMSFGLYSLPDTLFGYKIKKVDLLSDFKVKEEKLSLDSLKQQLEQADTLQVDSVALRDSIMRSAGIDSAALALRDSLYKAVYAVQGADSLGAHIEDYSLGHIGLQRFFAALKNRRELNRPVRVAFLGDSFIEGDIMVADFRSGMQKEFGGRGCCCGKCTGNYEKSKFCHRSVFEWKNQDSGSDRKKEADRLSESSRCTRE